MSDTYRIRKQRRDYRAIKIFKESATPVLLYDTVLHGAWTLTGYSLSAPERVTDFVQIPGRDGQIDLSYSLTGEPTYKNRVFTARFENSDGSRRDREEKIRDLMNTVEGRYVRLFTPDDEMHYLVGYMHIAEEYNDTNHCAVVLTGNVLPWREAVNQVFYDLPASSEDQIVVLKNNGGRRVIPQITAYADGTVASITISCGDYTGHPTLNEITPEELAMSYMEERVLTYSGTGHLVIRWREASL